jgi:amidase
MGDPAIQVPFGVMADQDLTFRTALELAADIKARKVSPTEVLDACLERADAVNPKVNALIWRNDDQARDWARAATEAVAKTDPSELAPFHGIPIPIKDLTDVAGWPVTYGSAAAPDRPSTESELVVEAFQRSGFILTGRTNTPEFGPITAAENLRYGVTRNPWNTDRTPGGSSGGAGAATAAGIFPLAHANDGGGSIRIPASCCGLVGLKVSRGRVPALYTAWEGGAVEGVVTRDVADTAAVLDVISGPDRGQWYNAPAPERPFAQEVGADPGRLRIGLVEEAPFGLPIEEVCLEASRDAARVLDGLGHHVEIVDLDVPEEFMPAFLNIVNSGLADYEDVDWSKAEPHIQENLARGREIDSLTYVRSVHQLQKLTRRLSGRWGSEFDILLTPTMTIQPPRAGEVLAAVHGQGEGPALQVLQMAVLTSGFNMSGQPAISLPTFMGPESVPIGIQLVAGPWEESLLLRLSAQMEEAVGWVDRRPSI